MRFNQINKNAGHVVNGMSNQGDALAGRRLEKVRVTRHFFVVIFLDGDSPLLSVDNGLPADATLFRIDIDSEPGYITLFYESSEFSPVPSSGIVPFRHVWFTDRTK